MKKKILITGASGFVGASLTRKLLEDGNEVHIISRKSSNLWRLGDILKEIQIHNVDLMNNEEISKLSKNINVDIVYHLATYGGYHFQSDANKIVDTNLIGTWNLFKAFSDNGIEMFVNTSSSSEYGEKFEPMDEEMNVKPNNLYGATKASATILCSTYAMLNKIPLVTLRLFSPYGAYDAKSRLIPTLIVSSLLNKDIQLTSKDSKRDFIFIDDVVNAYLSVNDLNNKFGEVYNVGSGKQYTVEEIANKVINIIGNDSVNVNWGNDFNRQYEPQMWVSDINKIYKDAKWRPQYDIDKGLKDTINWFRENIEFYK